jgi:hypothetical protein
VVPEITDTRIWYSKIQFCITFFFVFVRTESTVTSPLIVLRSILT